MSVFLGKNETVQEGNKIVKLRPLGKILKLIGSVTTKTRVCSCESVLK